MNFEENIWQYISDLDETPENKKLKKYLSNFGETPKETFEILINDDKFGWRVINKAVRYGDQIIPIVRETLFFSQKVYNRNAPWIACVLADIQTTSCEVLCKDLLKSNQIFLELIGATGLASIHSPNFCENELNLPILILVLGRCGISHYPDFELGAYDDGTYLEMAVDAICKTHNLKALEYLPYLLSRTPWLNFEDSFEKVFLAGQFFPKNEFQNLVKKWLIDHRFLFPDKALKYLILDNDPSYLKLAIERLRFFETAQQELNEFERTRRENKIPPSKEDFSLIDRRRFFLKHRVECYSPFLKKIQEITKMDLPLNYNMWSEWLKNNDKIPGSGRDEG